MVTAPEELREQLRGLSTVALVRAAAALRPGAVTTPMAAAKLALGTLAGRYQILSVEITALDAELDRRTQDYLARRLSQGKSRKEAIRCLKRYLVREVFRVLPRQTHPLDTS